MVSISEELSEQEFLERLNHGTLRRRSKETDAFCHDATEVIDTKESTEEALDVPIQDFASLFSGLATPKPEPKPKQNVKSEQKQEPSKQALHASEGDINPTENNDFSTEPVAEIKSCEVNTNDESGNANQTSKALTDKSSTKPKAQTDPKKPVQEAFSNPIIPDSHIANNTKNNLTYIIIGIATVILIVGGIVVGILSNNSSIAHAMVQTVKKERDIAQNYPDCSKSADLLAGKLSGLYVINEGNVYESLTNSVSDYENYNQRLAMIEQLCANEKAQKETEANAAAERRRLKDERAKLEAEKQAAETRAHDAQMAAQRAQAQAEEEKQRLVAQQQALAQQMDLAQQEPSTITTENRLTPVDTVKYPQFKHISWLIFYDNVLKKHCHVITNSKYPIMQTTRWCLPFSGLREDLTDTFAGTVAMNYEDRKICKKGSTKVPSNGQTRDGYCNQMFNDLQNQAKREHWASFSEICRISTDSKIKEYCGYLF